MPRYFFIRSVPLLVGVDAAGKSEGWEKAGNRVDDFMTDAMGIDRIAHDNSGEYILEYHGDAIYPDMIDKKLAKCELKDTKWDD